MFGEAVYKLCKMTTNDFLSVVYSSFTHVVFAVEKFQAAFLLLRYFGSAATYLNPESTRYSGMYTMEFDPVGNLLGATFRVSLSLASVPEHIHLLYVHIQR